MGEAAEGLSKVAGQGPHIGAFSACRLDHAMVGVGRVDQLEALDQRTPRGKLEVLVFPGKVVGPGAPNLERRVARRHLADLADEARQCRSDVGPRGSGIARRHDSAFGIVGVGGGAEAQRETVLLVAFHSEGHRLGRLAEGDGQDAGGERVERAGVACFLRTVEVPCPRYGLRRGHALRLVEDEPAVNWETFAPPRHVASACYWSASRSRATSGRARSSSMRFELAKEVSILNLISGMNFRLRRLASSPRQKRLCLSRRLTASSAPSPPKGSTKTVASFRSGAKRTSGTVSEYWSGTSSMISPRAKISASACRMVSPTFNWRCEGALPSRCPSSR